MNSQILDVHPKEMKFIFELKKQSTCEVRLTNKKLQNVAFKVKTTSPRKYCVRPNVGIVLPKSTCIFTVTMQAPKTVPPEMMCKDKFLIQSTVVPFGTTEKDITPNMFNKDEGKYIEEIKLKVVLISPPQSPVLSPINGVLKQGPLFDPSVLRDPILSTVDNTAPLHSVTKNVEFKMINDQDNRTEKVVELKTTRNVIDVEESRPAKNTVLMPNYDFINGEELNLDKDEELNQERDAIDDKLMQDVVKDTISDKQVKDAMFPLPKNAVKDAVIDELATDEEYSPPKNAVNDPITDTQEKDGEFPQQENAMKYAEFLTLKAVKELKLVSDIEEVKSKLNLLESKLNEAEATISNLTEQRRLSIQERKSLQEELVLLRSRTSAKTVQVGFPFLFVVMVALVSIFVGYHSHL